MKFVLAVTFVRMNRITGRSDDMLIIRGVNVFHLRLKVYS